MVHIVVASRPVRSIALKLLPNTIKHSRIPIKQLLLQALARGMQ
jgi:hypothetical protein